MKRQSKKVLLMSLLTAGAMLIAIGGFALPLSAVDFFGGEISISGFDYMELLKAFENLGAALNYPSMMIIVALALAAISLVAAGITAAARKRWMLIAPMVLSASAAVSMFLFLQDGLDSVAVGFALFMFGNVAAMVCAVIGIVPARERAATVPAANHAHPRCRKCGAELQEGVKFCRACGTPVAEAPKVELPKVEPKKTCRKCGMELQEGVKFCRACGTPVAEAPKVELPKVEPKKTCRKCGTELQEGVKFCRQCGTPVAEAPVVDEPVKEKVVGANQCGQCGAELKPGARFCVRCAAPVAVPVRIPDSESQSERKAICPYCGARQSAENMRCRNCGTAMR